MKDEIAVIMAAGLGTRMLPLTEKIAKPLVPVFGTPLIETIITALKTRDVKKIYIVVGYKKEQFKYLEVKYDNVELIENKEYLEKNNISSIKAAESVLGDEDCFICEGDLLIRDQSIFIAEFECSCYYAKFVEGWSDDWCFELDSDRMIKIKKGGSDLYNMVGVSYLKRDDLQIILDAVSEAYKEPNHGCYFWDEIVDNKLREVNLGVYPIRHGQIIEIDTLEELNSLSGSIS